MTSSRLRRIFTLALPITAGMLSQNIVNLVDIAFVKSLGDAALAAAGLGGFAAFTVMAFVIGLSTAVQTMVSRRFGETDSEAEALPPLRSGLLLALASGSVLTFVAYHLVPIVYPWLNQDPLVQEVGAEYLQLRLLATPFVGVNFAFRGFWNGIGRAKTYMLTLVIINVLNALFNYLLIFGAFGFPKLGLAGAGWGSTLAIFGGMLVYFAIALHRYGMAFLTKAWPRQAIYRGLLRLTLPAGLQQLFFAGGFLYFHIVVGWIGTEPLAACNILINILLFAILPAMGFGMAASTLVGQALGRGDAQDAQMWGWQVAALCSVCVLLLVSVPMVFFAETLLKPFAPSAQTLQLAVKPLLLTGLYMPLDVFGFVIMYALLGAGDVKRVLFISTGLQWGLFLVLATIGVSLFDVGLMHVWLLQASYRLTQTLLFAHMWHRGRWKLIQV